MKILSSIYSQFKALSHISVLILKITYCLFCAVLFIAAVLLLFPDITGNPIQSSVADALMSVSVRLLTLGVITGFSTDIVIRM